MEENASKANTQEPHNVLGNKFDPLLVDGHIIKPPLIYFDNKITVETKDGNINCMGTKPFSKIKELNKVDIYLLNLKKEAGELIWNKLINASKELGITFKEKPIFYPLDAIKDPYEFEKYISDYFNKLDDYYKDKEKNATDFIFMLMDYSYKNKFYYRIFKFVMNKYNWLIPTQVILYDKKK